MKNQKVCRCCIPRQKSRRTPPAAGFATGLCFYKLFWIFLVGCVIGCLVEMLWCYLNEGFFESRQGLIYGPFFPGLRLRRRAFHFSDVPV